MHDGPLHVIILNWNGERVIEPCLESLGAVADPPLSIIVVDNASSDSSPRIVRERFPHIELIVNERNLLFAEGNNVGIRRALARGAGAVLLLNNDTEVDPLFARRMLDALESDDRAGIVGPKIFYHDDPERLWYGGGGFYPLIWVPRHVDIRKLDGEIHSSPGDTGYVSGCAMLVRAAVFEDVGLLDPGYVMYCEDVDFCLRARRRGWRCRYEPRALVWHKVSSSSGGGFTPYKLEPRLVSTYRLFTRFRSIRWRVLVFPLHTASVLALIAVLIIRGRWGLLGGALRGLRRVLKGG
jgi:GT2 family glycosyltransferase